MQRSTVIWLVVGLIVLGLGGVFVVAMLVLGSAGSAVYMYNQAEAEQGRLQQAQEERQLQMEEQEELQRRAQDEARRRQAQLEEQARRAQQEAEAALRAASTVPPPPSSTTPSAPAETRAKARPRRRPANLSNDPLDGLNL